MNRTCRSRARSRGVRGFSFTKRLSPSTKGEHGDHRRDADDRQRWERADLFADTAEGDADTRAGSYVGPETSRGRTRIGFYEVALDAPVLHADDASRVLGDVTHLVRHENDGVALLPDVLSNAIMISPRPYRESGYRRLVGEDDAGLVHERARAIATRWRWPPDSFVRAVLQLTR